MHKTQVMQRQLLPHRRYHAQCVDAAATRGRPVGRRRSERTVIFHAVVAPVVGAAMRQSAGGHQRGGRVSGRFDRSVRFHLGANRIRRWHLMAAVAHVVDLIVTLVIVGRRAHLLRTTRPAYQRWRRGGRQRQSGRGGRRSNISKAHRPRPRPHLSATRGNTAAAYAAENNGRGPTAAASTA